MSELLIATLKERLHKSKEFLRLYGIKIDRYGWNAGYDQAVREEILWLERLLEEFVEKTDAV